ncbi:MAG: UDP-N-acetylmuramate--L-alanine ligase [Dehalococcoidia bacterium]|nr:UDP-N-acetylmuramate--L-alanine ligase [Dehalococcoidia bacterium]
MTEPSVSRPIPRRIHLVGIGGVHMSAIADILLTRGHEISGSDLRLSALTERLAARGAAVHEGHSAEYVDNAELVVTTSAATKDNPEINEARRRGIPVVKRADMVARLMEGKRSIAIAGTHGKTTTTSLVSLMLVEAGLSPTFLVGGDVVNLATNSRAGDGPHIVVEADEFDAAFLSYEPETAVVTNIEPDHLDFYGTFDELKSAFAQFLKNVPPQGRIIACADDPVTAEMLGRGKSPPLPLQTSQVEFYGLKTPVDWVVSHLGKLPGGEHEFLVGHEGRPYGEFHLRIPGRHNVSNALAAIAVGHYAGVPLAVMQKAVREFRGAGRRFQLVGEAAGVTVMDDYAHHPTEIRATIAAARERFPKRRLIAVFQPHTYSRTLYLLEEFRACFHGLHRLFILETYAAREAIAEGIDAAELARQVVKPKARYVATFEEAADEAAKALREGDVFFTIGAGDVDRVGPLVLQRLREKERTHP